MIFNDENIEAYLTGKLNAADKLAMEEGMKNDPLLKNEVELQNDIIESLKNTRKLQLKNRLNNIDVSASTTGVSSAVKVAASFITAGMIGAGIYYMSVFSSVDNKETKEQAKISNIANDENVSDQSPVNNNAEISKSNDQVIVEKGKNSNKNSVVAGNNKVTDSNNNTEENVTAVADVPNGSISDSESGITGKDINVPTGGINDAKVKKADNVDIGIDENIKKDLSYKFYNSKLFLSKDFEEQPYELIEYNTPKSKQLYLLFGGRYYEIKSNQMKAARLNEVKDTSVLRNLNK